MKCDIIYNLEEVQLTTPRWLVWRLFKSFLRGTNTRITRVTNAVIALGSLSNVVFVDKQGILSFAMPDPSKAFFFRSKCKKENEDLSVHVTSLGINKSSQRESSLGSRHTAPEQLMSTYTHATEANMNESPNIVQKNPVCTKPYHYKDMAGCETEPYDECEVIVEDHVSTTSASIDIEIETCNASNVREHTTQFGRHSEETLRECTFSSITGASHLQEEISHYENGARVQDEIQADNNGYNMKDLSDDVDDDKTVEVQHEEQAYAFECAANHETCNPPHQEFCGHGALQEGTCKHISEISPSMFHRDDQTSAESIEAHKPENAYKCSDRSSSWPQHVPEVCVVLLDKF